MHSILEFPAQSPISGRNEPALAAQTLSLMGVDDGIGVSRVVPHVISRQRNPRGIEGTPFLPQRQLVRICDVTGTACASNLGVVQKRCSKSLVHLNPYHPPAARR